MSVVHRYKNFDNVSGDHFGAVEHTEDELEDATLAAFDKGYRSGWDDAVKSQEDGDKKLTSEFLQNLQDLSFTYHEAHTKLTEALKPLLSDVVTKLLPPIAAQSLKLHIIEQISELLNTQDEALLELAVSEEKYATVEQLLSDQLSVPFAVVAEPALTGGQIYIRAGQTERQIDLDATQNTMLEAFEAYFHSILEGTNHG